MCLILFFVVGLQYIYYIYKISLNTFKSCYIWFKMIFNVLELIAYYHVKAAGLLSV